MKVDINGRKHVESDHKIPTCVSSCLPYVACH